MNEDLIHMVEDILEAASRHNLNVRREFEKESRGGYMSFPGFRAALCKFNKKYSEDIGSQKIKIVKILQPFTSREKKVSGAADTYMYDCAAFLAEIDKVISYLDTRDQVYDKIFASMQKGRKQLFKRLNEVSKSGQVPFADFAALLNETSAIVMTDFEKESIEYLYGVMDEINVEKFENGFKVRLEQRGRKFDNVTDSTKVQQYKKFIMANFYDYFTRYQILSPVNFFMDFGATNRKEDPYFEHVSPDLASRGDFKKNWTISRYSFKEAVYAVVPTLHEEQYLSFEQDISTDPISRISLSKFQEEYFRTVPTLTKEDYGQVGKIYVK
jgi:hypothetical protein